MMRAASLMMHREVLKSVLGECHINNNEIPEHVEVEPQNHVIHSELR